MGLLATLWVIVNHFDRGWARMGTDRERNGQSQASNQVCFSRIKISYGIETLVLLEYSHYPCPSAPIRGQNDLLLPIDLSEDPEINE